MFLKKAKNVEERLVAIDARVSELKKKRENKLADIEERKNDCAKHLAVLAMGDDATAEEGLKTTRKSLERLTESYNDIDQQITLLEGQKANLGVEFCEATVRDIPPQLDQAAQGYNLILAEALKAAETLQSLHETLKIKHAEFMGLSREYSEGCQKLKIVKPLELTETLGGPKFPTITFQLPADFSHFLGELQDYKSRVEGREGFLKSNPDFETNLNTTNERDSAPFQLDQMGDLFGKFQPKN